MELKLLKNLISSGDVVAVALSGGEDSCALLDALYRLQKGKNFTLKAITVEHGIRGEESLRDLEFCKQRASALNVEFLSFSVDAVTFAKENSKSIEESARFLRYDCFKKALESGFCNKIATAHHQGDLAETVLFNIFRGSGTSGAKGISPTTLGDAIIRPLLYTSKEEISQYVDYHHISFVTDSTNSCLDYSRNFLRHEVIPKIRERFSSFEDAITRFSISCAEDEDYFNKKACKVVNFYNSRATVGFCDKPIFVRATIMALKHIGIIKDFTATHINDIYNLFSLQSGSEVTLPKNSVAIKENNIIAFYSDKPQAISEKYSFELKTFTTDYFVYKIEKSNISEWENQKTQSNKAISDNFSPKTLFLDGDKIPKNAILRAPIEGDNFTSFSGHSKSLKKYLVDKKINKTLRKNLLVLCSEDKIFAVLGVEISNLCKIDQGTKNVIKVTCNSHF